MNMILKYADIVNRTLNNREVKKLITQVHSTH